jgi:hypothetical protein
LRKLEEESGGDGRLIILAKAENEDAEKILEANGITTTDKDLMVAVQRFVFADDRMPLINERIQLGNRDGFSGEWTHAGM